MRARDLGIALGPGAPGPLNGITDAAGAEAGSPGDPGHAPPQAAEYHS